MKRVYAFRVCVSVVVGTLAWSGSVEGSNRDAAVHQGREKGPLMATHDVSSTVLELEINGGRGLDTDGEVQESRSMKPALQFDEDESMIHRREGDQLDAKPLVNATIGLSVSGRYHWMHSVS